jgi:hypothetical protein
LQVSNHHYEVFKLADAIYRTVTLFIIGDWRLARGSGGPVPVFATLAVRDDVPKNRGLTFRAHLRLRLSARSISS